MGMQVHSSHGKEGHTFMRNPADSARANVPHEQCERRLQLRTAALALAQHSELALPQLEFLPL